MSISAFCSRNANKSQGGLNLPDIKVEMKKLGLDTKGTRDELRERLCSHIASQVKSQTVQQLEQPQEEPVQKLTKQQKHRLEELFENFTKLTPEEDREFEELSARWFMTLPMEKHRDKSWLIGEISDVYHIALHKATETERGRELLHRISNPQAPEHIKNTNVSPSVIKKSISYDSKRKILYLEGKILETMSQLVKLTYEHAGMIDLKKSGLFDRAIFGIGGESSAIIDDLFDFEITFHTHPKRPVSRINFDIPSEFDTTTILFSGLTGSQQVHIVFTNEAIYTLYSDPHIRGTTTDRDTFFLQARKYTVAALNGTMDDLNAYISFLKQHGIYMFRHSTNLGNEKALWNWPLRIPLYINPVEPIISLTKRVASRV